jgi:hypothetical protein
MTCRVRVLAATAVLWLATAAWLAAQAVAQPPAEKVFKNIQVLKGVPVDEFLAISARGAAAGTNTPRTTRKK